MGTQRRRYRAALDSLRTALEDWNREPELSFIADLGDIIDQQCEARGDSRGALASVLREWASAQAPVFHLVGNHELYNFSRPEMAALIPNISPWFRSFRPAAGWRGVILDPYDLNMIEKGGGATVEEGKAYLSRFNPNDLGAPRGTVDLGEGLEGLSRRFLPMGGALRAAQLAWLSEELLAAAAADERVIIFTHLPLLPAATVAGALTWNYEEVLDVLRGSGGSVALVLAGHYHTGGYGFDDAGGTHHVTLPSPLHTPDTDLRAHCTVEAWEDRLEIKGCGLVPSRSFTLRPRAGPHDPGSGPGRPAAML